jgi:phosphoglycolate phosphatase-like HAD superfamily hydrolase
MYSLGDLRVREITMGIKTILCDEVRDIKAARKGGIKIISLDQGANSKKALSALNPDYLIDIPQELFL